MPCGCVRRDAEDLPFGESRPQRAVGSLGDEVRRRVAALDAPQRRAVLAHGGDVARAVGEVGYAAAHGHRAGRVVVAEARGGDPQPAEGVRGRVDGQQFAVHGFDVEAFAVGAHARCFAGLVVGAAPYDASRGEVEAGDGAVGRVDEHAASGDPGNDVARGQEEAFRAVGPLPAEFSRRGVEAVEMPVPGSENQFPVRQRGLPLRLAASVVVTPQNPPVAHRDFGHRAVAQTDVEHGVGSAARDESLPDDRRRGVDVPPLAARAGVVGAQSVGRRARDDQPFGHEGRGVERPAETLTPHLAVAARVVGPQHALRRAVIHQVLVKGRPGVDCGAVLQHKLRMRLVVGNRGRRVGGEGQRLRVVLHADREAGARLRAQRLFAHADRVAPEVEQRVARVGIALAPQGASLNACYGVEVEQRGCAVVVAEQRERDAQPPERRRHLRAVREVVVQRIVAEAHDALARPGLGGLHGQPREVLGAHRSHGHLHKRSRSVAQKEVVPGTEGGAPVVAEDPGESRAGAFGPRGLVVARHGVPRFFEPRDQSVDVFQFGVAAQVGEVAAEDHDVARRGVDFVHRDAEQRILHVAGRHVDVGQKGDAERVAGSRGRECRRRPQRAEAQQDFGVFHWACAVLSLQDTKFGGKSYLCVAKNRGTIPDKRCPHFG